MAEENTNNEGQQPFDSLGVPVGSPLTIETLSPHRRLTVKMIGYVSGRSILISPPMREGKEQLLEVGETVAVRLLIRKKICAFEARIKYRSLQPYTYYHIEYPSEMVSLQVRSSERVSVNIPVLIESDFDIGMGEWPKQAVITDLSKTGTALKCAESIGDKGHEVIVKLDVNVSGLSRSLSLNGVIRNKELQGPDSSFYTFGLEFTDVRDEDKLSLAGFIYEKEINPSGT